MSFGVLSLIAMKIFAKKSLGQHFLNSTHVLEQIIQAAQIKPEEKVLEIGPGMGVLTKALLAAGANVVSVEKDDRPISMLGITFEKEIAEGKLKLVHGDILSDFTQSSQVNLGELKNAEYAIVANIPYYITGAILEKFLEHEPRPNRMVLLVQKEVAERIVARDGKESILSVSVKAFGTPRIIAKVPPGAFTPPPTVDSAILIIEDISDRFFVEKGVSISRYFEIVRAGFAHKRKYVARNLEAVLLAEEISRLWTKLQMDPRVRAEDLCVAQWQDIARF